MISIWYQMRECDEFMSSTLFSVLETMEYDISINK